MGTTNLTNRVAAEVRAEMARQRKSGVQLGQLLDLSQTSTSRRLLGQTAFTLDELAQVASWLGVEVADLLAPRWREEHSGAAV